MKLQIISDTHLEFYETCDYKKFVEFKGEVICLLGDICLCGNDEDFVKLVNFIGYLSLHYKYILFVPGNHEYYTTGNDNITLKDTITRLDKKIKKISKIHDNFKFINNDIFTIKHKGNTYSFIGTTLWSHVDPKNQKAVQARMNDYKEIYIADKKIRKFTVHDMDKLHKKSMRFLSRSLKKLSKTNNTIILLTHHKPIYDSKDKKKDPVFVQAYTNDLLSFLSQYNIKLAAHGHTHVPYDAKFGKIRFVSNPKGYKSQRTWFKKEKVYLV